MGAVQRERNFFLLPKSPACPAGGLGPGLPFPPGQWEAFAAPGSQLATCMAILDLKGCPRPSLLRGLEPPLALSGPIPRPFGQLLGPTSLSLRPRQELPACLGLTPGPLTPALALADEQALLNLQHYLLSWGDLCPGEREK